MKIKKIYKEIESLTSLRFFLAFIIFLFHSKVHFEFKVGISLVDNFINNGAIFMTGFFILSGYILTHVYQDVNFKKTKEILNFFIKRLSRIYPVYLIMSIVYFILIKGEEYVFTDWLRIIVNDFFLIQAFFPGMFYLGANSTTWSVSIEAFFYLFFPLVILLFKDKAKLLLSFSYISSIIITLNIICYSLNQSLNKIDLSLFYSNPIMRLNEFLIGIATYLIMQKYKQNNIPQVLKSPILIFLFIFLFSLSSLSSYKFSYMGLQFINIALLSLFILSLHKTNTSLINNNLFKYFGRISYSFYLWQFVPMELAKYLKLNFSINNTWVLFFIALTVNLIIASISYHLLEEKFRNSLRKLIA